MAKGKIMSLLKLRNICKTYLQGGLFQSKKRHDVLVDVSLSIDEGMCLGLVGESGCGKSTLARIALGLEKPDFGAVDFMGCNLFEPKALRTVRRNLQVVFQDCFSSVNPRFEAENIIREPLRNFEKLTWRQEQNRAIELLETVGLKPEDAKKYPHQFSGGELQRVCIARAIALKPKLIILDEAVSNLDMLIQSQILELLKDLQNEFKMAYLFISHDVRMINRICDALAVMHNGRIAVFSDDIKNLEELYHL